MKILNKIRNYKGIMVLSLFSTILFSCSDYLDVDTDTDNPTVAPLNFLLTGVELNIANIGDFNTSTGGILSTYTHQFTSREEEDQYGVKVDNIALNNDWDNVYLTLNDVKTLIDQGTASGDMVYVGVGQVLKAYTMSCAVDLWGDVPYSEATQLNNGIFAPKFDNQKVIYDQIFALIDAAKVNINSNLGGLKPGVKDDLFYGGNVGRWTKFANTLKLKLYNQTRLLPDFDQVGFDALILENKFFTALADDFQFKHYSPITPTNERNKLFREAYESTQFGSYQSPWFYEILKGVNPNIFTGIADPRMKYYFYNQLAPGQFPPDQGDAGTGNPGADYWDSSTGFFSIRFGSTGPDRDKSAENSYTYPGIFACGGRYDDGNGGSVATLSTAFSGSGIAPKRILTFDEYLYIKAELIQVGKLPGNAATTLQQAMTASMAKVDKVVDDSGTTQNVPNLVGANSAPFITSVINYFNANPAKKLEIIMTQKWIATYGDPLDQYTDYRRTGFPILANPAGASPEYQLNNANGFPLNDAQTVLNNPFQLSLYWPQTELNINANAPGQKDPATYKIFWDN